MKEPGTCYRVSPADDAVMRNAEGTSGCAWGLSRVLKVARPPRVVIPGVPLHVTQCGNGRQRADAVVGLGDK